MEGVWWELGDIDQATEANLTTFTLGTSEAYIAILNFRPVDI